MDILDEPKHDVGKPFPSSFDVADFNRILPSAYLDQFRSWEIVYEFLVIEGGASNDHPEIRTSFTNLFEIPKKKITEETVFVRLVNNDATVLREHRIRNRFSSQDPVRDELHTSRPRDLSLEADLITDFLPNL
jgi:hypothetical protein